MMDQDNLKLIPKTKAPNSYKLVNLKKREIFSLLSEKSLKEKDRFELENMQNDKRLNNIIEAYYFLFKKEILNPDNDNENFKSIFDNLYEVLGKYSEKILNVYLYKFQENRLDDFDDFRDFISLYKKYENDDKNFDDDLNDYKKNILSKIYVSIDDFQSWYKKSEKECSFDTKKLDKLTISERKKIPFYKKWEIFFDEENFKNILNWINSKEEQKENQVMKIFLKQIYDKKYSKIPGYKFEKYLSESKEQRKEIIKKKLENYTANDIYFVVWMFETKLRLNTELEEENEKEEKIESVSSPVTQLVLEWLDLTNNNYKNKLKLAKDRIPNIFAQSFDEDIANIEYLYTDENNQSFNFYQISKELIKLTNTGWNNYRKSLKDFVLDLDWQKHKLFTQAPSKNFLEKIISKYGLGKIKDEHGKIKEKYFQISNFFEYLIENIKTDWVIKLFKDVWIENIENEKIIKNLEQYKYTLDRADDFVKKSINRANKDKDIMNKILNYWQEGTVGFGVDMSWKWIKWKASLNNNNQLQLDCIINWWNPEEKLKDYKEKIIKTSSSNEREKIEKLKEKIKSDKEKNIETIFWTDGNWNIVTWIHPAPLKKYDRAIEKLIEDYKCDFSKSTDMSRATLEYSDLKALITGMQQVIKSCKDDENVEQIAIVDKIWPVFEMAKEPTWYRDIKLLIKLKNWNTVELMFHTTQTLEIKQKWLKWSIINKYLEDFWINFLDDEIKYFNKHNWKNIKMDQKQKKFPEDVYLSWDDFYHVHRNLLKYDPLKQKLQKAESIVREHAWLMVIRELMPKKNSTTLPPKK